MNNTVEIEVFRTANIILYMQIVYQIHLRNFRIEATIKTLGYM